MFKQITTVSAFMISAFTFSQVGIDTPAPKATLDVVGKADDIAAMDGIIAPRIEGAKLRAKTYTTEQTGALVYVTLADTAPAGQTIDVTAAGYYYFNGLKWVIAGAGNMVNIYNANGSLTNARTLTLNGFPLNFTGAQQRSNWNANGLFTVNNLQPTDGEASMGFIGGNNSNVYIQQFRGGTAQMIANGNNTQLIIGTGYTTPPSGVRFDTSPGGGVMGEARMHITPIGNVKIGANDEGTEKLDVEGIARVRELPLDGAANAHNTLPDGTLSATQDQTFTATKTVVADDNGVLGYVTALPGASQNIYNANGSLTSARTLTNNGFGLTFLGTNQSTSFSPTGGLTQTGLGTSSKRASVILRSNDNNSDGVASSLQLFQDPESAGQILVTGDSRSLSIGTTNNTLAAHINFVTSTGSGALGTEKMRITGIGNVGIGISNSTEKLDVNGITRLRSLPLNGSANAIFTMPSGNASATQNQTFTATKTVVADENGVVGYVTGIPSDAGTSKVLVIANAPGTQNISGQVIPNAAIGQFTVEGLDTYNAWTNNVFTVPADLGGIYIIVMQNSNTHVSTGTATPTWHTMAFYERSTDGGTSWSTMIKHTYSNLAGTVVDNGNTLYWTGSLNAGDRIRVRLSCNATTDNIVNYGGISITKLAQ